MSDEKLSEATQKEVEGLEPTLERLYGIIPLTTAIVTNHMRPILARLECERDAARSEVLRMAEKLKITDPLLQSPAYSVGWNAALDMLIGDIGCLSPSVVSQPSREREVLGARLDELEWFYRIAGFVERETIMRRIKHYREQLAALTATPASTGGGK